MGENLIHNQKQIAYSYENEEEETYFDALNNTLLELNHVIIQFLDLDEEDYKDRDGSVHVILNSSFYFIFLEFIEHIFRNFYLRQNYLKLLLQKTSYK